MELEFNAGNDFFNEIKAKARLGKENKKNAKKETITNLFPSLIEELKAKIVLEAEAGMDYLNYSVLKDAELGLFLNQGNENVNLLSEVLRQEIGNSFSISIIRKPSGLSYNLEKTTTFGMSRIEYEAPVDADYTISIYWLENRMTVR